MSHTDTTSTHFYDVPVSPKESTGGEKWRTFSSLSYGPKTIRSLRMILRKCSLVAFFFLCLVWERTHGLSPIGFFHDLELNCSVHCACDDRNIEAVLRNFGYKQMSFMGEKYRPDLQYGIDSGYVNFLGLVLMIIHRLTEITCTLNDGQPRKISALLNGVERSKNVALHVKCLQGEQVIWDVQSWQTSFNIFASEKCQILPAQESQDIVMPMNIWIVRIEDGGPDLLPMMDINYLMNTVSITVTGSKSAALPESWKDKYLISVSSINLRANSIKSFDCSLRFTEPIDTLNLGGNELSRFPDCLLDSRYIQLSYLSLSNNQIDDISPIFEAAASNPVDMPAITIIDLSYNNFEELLVFRRMDSLIALDLSNNGISEISANVFENLVHLEQLYLSNNRIHTLADSLFVKNVNLNSLDLRFNLLTTMKRSQIHGNSAILTIDARRNLLTVPPFHDCAQKQYSLKFLNVLSSSNPYVCDCKLVEFQECTDKLDAQFINSSQSETVFIDLEQMKCAAPTENRGRSVYDIQFIKQCTVEENCPASCDCSLFDREKMVVNCSGRRLLEMPDTIPIRPNTSILLFLDHNPLQMLSFRSYLSVLSELHMDNCLLTSVTPAAILSLRNVRVLTLHNNLLQKLPSSTRNITLNNASNVTLHNNRWSCSCESLWLPRWISKHRAILWMPGDIVCSYQRKPVEEFSDLDVNCSSSSYVDLLLAVCLAMSSLVSTLIIIFYYRSEINFLLYSKFGLRLGCNFTHGDLFNPYDAFVSYSQDNYKWVVDTLVPRLENGPHHYRLCLHYRDFPAGEPIIDNIPWAIRLSRCSILVLSRDFLKKEWCMMELRAVFQRLLLVANRLIIIATDDISPDELSMDLRAYMNTHDYLRVNEAYFWEKLEMFLPPRHSATSAAEEDINARAGRGAGDSEYKMLSQISENSQFNQPNMDAVSCESKSPECRNRERSNSAESRQSTNR